MKRSVVIIMMSLACITCFSQDKNNLQKLLADFDQLNNKTFPFIELEDNNGKAFNTALLKGKTLYVDFWFTQCPPCLKEIPYSKALQRFFAADTNVVFVNICIEYENRRQAWKDMITAQNIGGINLFYAKNRPQKVNLLREFKVETFPTYMIVDSNMVIIGHNGPAPTDKGLVNWSIYAATKNIKLSDAFRKWISNDKQVKDYMNEHKEAIDKSLNEMQ